MTTKWNLIHLDLVPFLDKFSAGGEEEEGKLFLFGFFRDVLAQPLSLPTVPPPPWVEKAMGCMDSDNAAAPVE